MIRFRLAVLVLVGATFLAAPLSALCSSCCVSESGQNAISAPMPCCGDDCGPSFTAARPRDPAVASPRTRIDPPVSTGVLQLQANLLVASGFAVSTVLAAPTESPPVSTSVLRL